MTVVMAGELLEHPSACLKLGVKIKCWRGWGKSLFFVSLHAPALVHLINFKILFKAMLLYEGVIPLSPVRSSQAGSGGVAGDVTLPLPTAGRCQQLCHLPPHPVPGCLLAQQLVCTLDNGNIPN